MVCASGKMVCAPCENGLRSWQNGLRLISKLTDVIGKMICAWFARWFALDLRYKPGGACSAAQIIFIPAEVYYIHVYTVKRRCPPVVFAPLSITRTSAGIEPSILPVRCSRGDRHIFGILL